MIPLLVRDETAPLKSVVVGVGKSSGEKPHISEAYDAKSYHSLVHDIYPDSLQLEEEVNALAALIEAEGIDVLRPELIPDYNQIFARDVAFVIEDKLVKANIIPERERELKAYDAIFQEIAPAQIVVPPAHVHIEGGDVILANDKIYLGIYIGADYAQYSMARTNKYAPAFLKDLFPEKEIIPLQLKKNDTDPFTGVLHLDCCFQPVGKSKALLYPAAFMNPRDYEYILNAYGSSNVFIISQQEMFEMNTNIFSLSPDKVIIDKRFRRLKNFLEEAGVQCLEIAYEKVSRLGGLLRCSTLPLVRDYTKQ